MKRYFTSERGSVSIEYGLLAVLVALVGLFALEAVGTNLADLFKSMPHQNTTVTKP